MRVGRGGSVAFAGGGCVVVGKAGGWVWVDVVVWVVRRRVRWRWRVVWVKARQRNAGGRVRRCMAAEGVCEDVSMFSILALASR